MIPDMKPSDYDIARTKRSKEKFDNTKREIEYKYMMLLE